MPPTLTRKVGQKLIITIAPEADPQEALRALQAEGIEIVLREIYDHASKERLLVVAPRELLVLLVLLVLREELVKGGKVRNNLELSNNGRLDKNNGGVPCEAICVVGGRH